jgi:hypothetical protein
MRLARVLMLVAVGSMCMLAGCSSTPELSPDQNPGEAAVVGNLHGGAGSASGAGHTLHQALPPLKGSSSSAVVAGAVASAQRRAELSAALSAGRGRYVSGPAYVGSVRLVRPAGRGQSTYTYHASICGSAGPWSTARPSTPATRQMLLTRSAELAASVRGASDDSVAPASTAGLDRRMPKLVILPWLSLGGANGALKIR